MTADTPRDLVTCGEALAVFLGALDVPLDESATFRRTVAGTELNVAVAMARLGHNVSFYGRTGQDALGRVIRSRLGAEGIGGRLTEDASHPTGLLVRGPAGSRATEVVYGRARSAGSGLRVADLPEDLRGTRAVFITGTTAVLAPTALEAVQHLAVSGKAAGATVVLDPNVRLRLAPPRKFKGALSSLLPSADIVLAGDDELAIMVSGRNTRDRAKRIMGEYGVSVVVAKHGRDGSSAYADDKEWSQPSVPTDVVDTIGAGDAYAGGFISGTLSGLSIDASMARGAHVAAACCSVYGDIEGLPRTVGAASPEVTR